ncbi:MAG: hypothetical protein ACK40G_00400 [Cytophagaceae bacterium]
MKRLLSTLFLLSFCLVVKAQNLPVDPNTGKVTFMEVVDAKGLTDKDIMAVVEEWGKTKKYEVKSKDDGSMTIIYNGAVPMEYEGMKPGKKDKANVKFTVSVFCKADKYRFIITDLVHEGLLGAGSGGKLENAQADCGKEKMQAKTWVQIKNMSHKEINLIIEDLKRVIRETQNDPAKKSDW